MIDIPAAMERLLQDLRDDAERQATRQCGTVTTMAPPTGGLCTLGDLMRIKQMQDDRNE